MDQPEADVPSASFDFLRNKVDLRTKDGDLRLRINDQPVPLARTGDPDAPRWTSEWAYGEFVDPRRLAEAVIRTQQALAEPRLKDLRAARDE